MDITWAPGEHVSATFTPVNADDAPLLVIWPAFGTPATFYRHLTPALAEAGMASLVVEYPGRETPRGVGRHSTYGYDLLAQQVHEAVMTAAHALRPMAPVFLLGHSLGGHVAMFAAATHPQGPAAPHGVIFAASGNPYWRAYGTTWFARSLLGTALMAAVARAVGYWPGDRLRFWGRQSRVLVADWARLARTGRVNPSGAQVDYGDALAAYDGEVLAFSVPDDSLAPVAACEAFLRLSPRARVTRYHAATRLGHIQWVRRHGELVFVIAAWVFARVDDVGGDAGTAREMAPAAGGPAAGDVLTVHDGDGRLS